MTNSNRPKWLDVDKLKKVAGKEAEQRSQLHVNLPVHSRKVIASYTCPDCKLQFTTSDVEAQVKKAARTGTHYIECPKCGGTLREGRTAVVKDVTSIVNRADKYRDSNKAPSRGINTWVDKAIYGRLVQKLGEHIQQYGISNPQLKFQRGIRAQKFPGQPKTAKGAEFTVEFVDFNNTRNRIIIQAGLNIKGELIFPRTFRTLSGTEYPLTKQAIDDLTSGKLYDPVMSDATIGPLTYRYPDPTRFREISAGNKKMQKKAQGMDPAAMDAEIQGMGVTDPNDIQAMKDVLTKYQATPAGSTPIGAPPAINVAPPATGGGAFMNGVGLANKLNMKKKAFTYINTPDDAIFDLKQDPQLQQITDTNTRRQYVDDYIANIYDDAYASGYDEALMQAQYIGIDPATVPKTLEEFEQRFQPHEDRIRAEVLGNNTMLANKLNMKKADVMNPYLGNPPKDAMGMQPSDVDNTWEQIGVETLYETVMDGLSFPEAYDAVRTATQGNALITQAEYDQMGQLITGDDQSDIIANKAAELIKLAEIDTIKHLHKTAETIRDEFAFDDMSSVEAEQWVETYVDTYNKTLDDGEGIIAAAHKAHKTAVDTISEYRVKHALRDKDTLVPLTETDPDYSIATTDEFEAEFGGKYEDTDGGILPMEDREYATMFKGSAVEINRKTGYADIKQKDDKWVVTPKGNEKVLGEHATKGEAVKQLQAIEISKHKESKKIIRKNAIEYQSEGFAVDVAFNVSNLQHAEVLKESIPRNLEACAKVSPVILETSDPTISSMEYHYRTEGEARHAAGNIKQYFASKGWTEGSAMEPGTFYADVFDIAESTEGTEGTEGTEPSTFSNRRKNILCTQSSIAKKAAYVLTMDGQNILAQLAGGSPVAGPNSEILHTVLRWIMDNPTSSLEEMAATYTTNVDMLRQAVQYALTLGYVDITAEQPVDTGAEGIPPIDDTGLIAFKLNMQKGAESTGVDLDADEVGQNPMNYSRLKGQIQDLLRAGNIPPSKVDMHKLKDGGYSLDELRNLIDTFKVNKDTYFPTAHAKIDPTQLQKKAEEKLSDLLKKMPLEKEDTQPPRQHRHRTEDEKLPSRRTEICPNKDEVGNIPPRQWKNRRDENA